MVQVRAQAGGGDLIMIDPWVVETGRRQGQDATGSAGGALAWLVALLEKARPDRSSFISGLNSVAANPAWFPYSTKAGASSMKWRHKQETTIRDQPEPSGRGQKRCACGRAKFHALTEGTHDDGN